jgi:hypothetical protein
MIFSTIFAEVLSFASLLTPLSGLAMLVRFSPSLRPVGHEDAKGEQTGLPRSHR